jgi:hypothetical protein
MEKLWNCYTREADFGVRALVGIQGGEGDVQAAGNRNVDRIGAAQSQFGCQAGSFFHEGTVHLHQPQARQVLKVFHRPGGQKSLPSAARDGAGRLSQQQSWGYKFSELYECF